jgi:hypothetical protein
MLLLLLFMGWTAVCQKVTAGESGLGPASGESRAGLPCAVMDIRGKMTGQVAPVSSCFKYPWCNARLIPASRE